MKSYKDLENLLFSTREDLVRIMRELIDTQLDRDELVKALREIEEGKKDEYTMRAIAKAALANYHTV